MAQQKIASNELEFSSGVFPITGGLSVSAGSNMAPSITTAGDTNTGIFFPAADTIAFSEGGVESGRFTSTGALQLNNNLTFSGTGNRITGDFSNGTRADRVAFQSSTTNGATRVGLIPNGTSSQAIVDLYNGTDLNNTGTGQLSISSTEFTIRSAIFGTGTYVPMTFFTGGSERLRIDTSGNVGIGLSNPDFRLDVARGSSGVVMNLQGTDAYDAETGILFSSQRAKISGFLNSGGAIPGSSLRFYTMPDSGSVTERMRITSGGGVRIACENFANQPSSTNWGIELNNTSASSVFFGQGTGTETHINFGNRNGTRGSIQTNSTNTLYNTTSDYRLKENVAPMTGALAKVSQLKPSTYTWKVDGSDGQGFIAHELQAVIPDAVTGEKDAVDEDGEPKYQMVDTSFLVATLTAAIQELKAEFDEYKRTHS